jgi:hypothetical protein
VWGLKAADAQLNPIFSGRRKRVMMHKFNALLELQKLALGHPTKVSPQTIALYVLSSVEWVTKKVDKRDDLPRLERLFKVADPRD